KALCDFISNAKNAGYGTEVYSQQCEYSPAEQLTELDCMRDFIEKSIAHFDPVLPEDFPMLAAPAILLEILSRSNETMEVIDFDDMIYLPILKRMHLTQYDYLVVDEAQDLSALQHAFVLKAGRRLIFVGDDRQ